MTKSPRKNVPDMGIELGAACMPSELASDRATAPGTKSEKNTKISESKFNLYLTCFHEKLCVISQQKQSFSFKIFLILKSCTLPCFIRGDKSWHSIKASTGHPVLVLFLDELGHLWHWSERVSQSEGEWVSDWVRDWVSDWSVSQSVRRGMSESVSQSVRRGVS